MFFKFSFQPPQPAVSTAKPQQHTNSISTQFLEGLMCPCLATTSPSKPLSAYRAIFLKIISSAFLKCIFKWYNTPKAKRKGRKSAGFY
jgi:hypothetical protein